MQRIISKAEKQPLITRRQADRKKQSKLPERIFSQRWRQQHQGTTEKIIMNELTTH
jgi:hypothetical protein